MLAFSDFLAVIPARSGSKRLPNKNRRTLIDRPMLDYTVTAVQDSKVPCGILSSDSLEYKTYARGKVSFHLRSRANSADESTAVELIEEIESIGLFEDKNKIVILQPTSPLRTSAHIDQAIQKYIQTAQTMNEHSQLSLVSASKCKHIFHPFKQFEIDESDFQIAPTDIPRMQPFQTYYRNGAIYIADKNSVLKDKTLIHSQNIIFKMSHIESLDIDDAEDFFMAEALLNHRQRDHI